MLETSENKALILCSQAIDAKPYNVSGTDSTWKNGAYVNRFNKETNCWWWLRTQGIENNTASGVDISGKIDHIGNTNNIVDNCVRPAMWINLN